MRREHKEVCANKNVLTALSQYITARRLCSICMVHSLCVCIGTVCVCASRLHNTIMTTMKLTRCEQTLNWKLLTFMMKERELPFRVWLCRESIARHRSFAFLFFLFAFLIVKRESMASCREQRYYYSSIRFVGVYYANRETVIVSNILCFAFVRWL